MEIVTHRGWKRSPTVRWVEPQIPGIQTCHSDCFMCPVPHIQESSRCNSHASYRQGTTPGPKAVGYNCLGIEVKLWGLPARHT